MTLVGPIPIKDFMITNVIALDESDKVGAAYHKMKQFGIRHLPVVNAKGELIGIFSDRDLHHAYAPRETESGWYYDRDELDLLQVAHFMSKNPSVLYPDDSLQEAAKQMAQLKIGCIPILERGTRKLVGVVSTVDVLRKISIYF